MSDPLSDLEQAFVSAAAALSADSRAKLTREIAKMLRRSNAARITRQVSPDGQSWAPRKPRRDPSHSIKGKLLVGYRKASILRAKSTANDLEVGFLGALARRARIHSEGLPDRVSKDGPMVKYTPRPLIGISAEDERAIREMITAHIAHG